MVQMRKLVPDLDGETHELLSNSEIQTDHFIPDRRLGIVLIYKKK